MARLPQAADLMREPVGLDTPAVKVRPIDHSPTASAANALAKGVNSIALGLDATWKANEEAADYQTKKALADFRLATDAELDAYTKEMPPGATGWAEGWEKRFEKRANQFVQGLPGERQKELVQASLIAQHQRLQSHANGIALKERDRFIEDGLANTLNGLVNRTDLDPARMRDARTEGRQLIEKSDLSPARKSVLLGKYRKAVEGTAIRSRIAVAKTPEEFEAIRKDVEGRKDGEALAGPPGVGVAYSGPYKNLDASDRATLRRVIDHEEKNFLAGARYEIKQQMQSDLSLIETTGEGLPRIDLERAKKILEPNQVNRYLRQREVARYAYKLQNNLSSLPDDEIVARFRDLAPARDADFDARNRVYQKGMRAVQKLQELRRDDPARSVEDTEDLKAARANAQGDPISRGRRIMAARMRAQESVGIAEAARSPITEGEARQLLAPLVGLKGEYIYPELQKLVPQIVAQYGEYADEALRYMARTLYKDSASQEVFQGVIQNIKDTGMVEAAEKERMKALEEINGRSNAMNRGAGSFGQSGLAAQAPPEAIAYLKAHPETAELFDRKYGAGVSEKILKAK